MFVVFWPQVVSQASQHFRSSEVQTIIMVAFTRQSICSFISLHSGMSTGVSKDVCRTLVHASLGFPFRLSLFVASSLNLWRWWHLRSDCHPLRQSRGRHMSPLPPPLESWRLRTYRLHCFPGWWSRLAWQWSPTLTGLWWLIWDPAVCCCCCCLLVCLFSFNEKLDCWIHFACCPFLTVP